MRGFLGDITLMDEEAGRAWLSSYKDQLVLGAVRKIPPFEIDEAQGQKS